MMTQSQKKLKTKLKRVFTFHPTTSTHFINKHLSLKIKKKDFCLIEVKKTAIASPTPPRGVLEGPSLHMSHQQNRRPQRHAPPAAAVAQPLRKQHSWSPDMYRDEAWLRRKGNFKSKRSKSVTDEDVDELKACFELGFGFDSPAGPDHDAADQRLADTLPALGLYHAVNKRYLSKSTPPSSSTVSDSDTLSPLGSPHTIFATGENDPETVKTRLRQWAQVVACSVRQFSSS